MRKNTIHAVLASLPILTLIAVAAYAGPSGYKGYPRGNALITVQELRRLIDAGDSNLVVLAAESDPEYLPGHIPGARQVDRPAYEAPADTQDGVTGNLIDTIGFTRLAQRLGIRRDSVVVLYDDKFDATRLWWAFTYYGKSNVRVLDGGIQSWKAAGYPVEILPRWTSTEPGDFVAVVARPRLRVDTPEIATLRDHPERQLWDDRSLPEFTGEELKKGAYRAGRIPWSRHAEWTLFKKKENRSEWIPAAEMAPLLRKLGYDPKKEQYFYCQTGVRSTQGLFALYLSGWPLEKLHNYDSSWIGWSKDASLPLLTGIPAESTPKQARR